MATATKRRKQPANRPQAQKPVLVTGGIDANKTYSLSEFLVITGINRQKLSELRKKGFVVRDTGANTPTVLGSDWIDFVKTCGTHVPKLRGKHNPKESSV
jgi:hypothetical protein